MMASAACETADRVQADRVQADRVQAELGMAAAPEALRAWLAEAAPGNMAIYAIGLDLPREAEGVQLVRAWQAEGLVALVSRRDPADRRRTQWLVQRAGATSPAAKPGLLSLVTRQQLAALLILLREGDKRRRPCPSNNKLARELDLGWGERGRARARYLIDLLVRDGAITVESRGRNLPRVVTILKKESRR